MSDVAVYVPITKVDDEQRMVWGVATSEALDSQGDILDWAGTLAALDGYRAWGNVREMHQPSAVGKAVEYHVDDVAKTVTLGTRVVDDSAWAKVKAGVYNGYSIGGAARETRSEMAKVGDVDQQVRRVLKWDWSETSLVDRPANPTSMFTMFKRDLRKDDEGAQAKTATEIAAAIKALIVREASEPDTESYDLDLLIAALRSLEWFAQDEMWEAATMKAVRAYDLRKHATGGDEMDSAELSKVVNESVTAALAGVTSAIADLNKRMDEAAAANPLAKLDFSTLAKAEDIKVLGDRIEKIEKTAIPGGPVVNGNAPIVLTRTDKSLDPLGKLDGDLAGKVRELQEKVATVADPHERERLGKAIAAEQARAIFSGFAG